MIEDDLCSLLTDAVTVPIYARLIPPRITECVSIQAVGGAAMPGGIHKARYTVSLLAVSADKAAAMQLVRTVRDYVIKHLPADINDTHYYYATPIIEAGVKTNRADRVYIEFSDIEVVASI